VGVGRAYLLLVGNFSRATTQAKSRTAAGIGARLLGRSSRLPRCVPCSL